MLTSWTRTLTDWLPQAKIAMARYLCLYLCLRRFFVISTGASPMPLSRSLSFAHSSLLLLPFPCAFYVANNQAISYIFYNVIYNVCGSATSLSTVGSVRVDLRLCIFSQKGRFLLSDDSNFEFTLRWVLSVDSFYYRNCSPS